MAASKEKTVLQRHSKEISGSLAAKHSTCLVLANELYSRELIAEVYNKMDNYSKYTVIV